MKKAKILSEAQKIAWERNSNKGRIMCMNSLVPIIYNAKTTTKEEQKSLDIIKNHLNKILKNWCSL